MGASRKLGILGLLIVLGAGTAIFVLSGRGLPDASELQKQFLGKPVPDVSLQDQSGKEISLRDRLQGKTLVSLWATWCAPCLKELPLLQKKRDDLAAQGVSIVLVNYEGGAPEEARKQAKAWLDQNGVTLPTYYDTREGLLEALRLAALPYSFLGDSQGTLVWQQQGIVDFAALERAVKAAGR